MIQTTGELKEAIRSAYPNSAREEKNSTIKRVFQSLRIATNTELLNLQHFLEHITRNPFMDSKSILMVITFHSLEEKIIS